MSIRLKLARRAFFSFAILWLAAVMFASVACRANGQDSLVVTEVVMVEGEEVVVTRIVRQTIPVPVTVTPPAESVVLDVAYPGEPEMLDPQRASSTADLTLVENLFVGLTRYNHTEDRIDPDLATEWEVADGGRTWTFYLRPDVFWVRRPAEGAQLAVGGGRGPEAVRPVVAGDVVSAVQRLCSESQSADVFIFFLIEGCEAVYSLGEPTPGDLEAIGVSALNDTTVRFSLTKPAAYFLTMTSMNALRPIPADIIAEFAEEGEEWAAPENVVTSGPFVIGAETAEGALTGLERNPFWPVNFPGNVDRVNLWWLDDEAAYELWTEKDVDIAPLPADKREEVQNNPIFRTRVREVTLQRAFYLAFNLSSPVFGEDRVRRAFAAAIDREALIDEVYAGYGDVARHFTPPGVIGAPPADVVGLGYNEDFARIEMAESSFRDCRFIPEVRYAVASQDRDLFHAETLRTMWARKLNCDENQIVIEQLAFGTLLANTREEAGARRPDLWNLGWASFYPDAHNWLTDVLHCSDSDNRQGRACTEADGLLREAAVTQDLERRRELYRQVERLFFGEDGSMPIAPLMVQSDFVLVHPWIQYAPAHFGAERFDAYRVDAEAKRLERQQ